MKLHELSNLNESINDKGIFKAVFLAGPPGSGKTYVSQKIGGGIEARVVNTDKFLEFLGKKKGIDMSSKENQRAILDDAKHLTRAQFANYLNGMLPLFIDGTSSNVNNLLRRVGLLESLGYDVAMVWVDTDLETSLQRAKSRERKVDEEFIKKVHQASETTKSYYRNKFGKDFHTIKNNEGELTDEIIVDAFKKVNKFFTAPIDNPVGAKIVKDMKDENEKYLVPSQVKEDELNRLLSVWYKKDIK